VVRAAPGTLVRLGDLHHPAVLVAMGGTLLVGVLRARRHRGAILAAHSPPASRRSALGLVPYQGLLAAPPSLAPTFAASTSAPRSRRVSCRRCSSSSSSASSTPSARWSAWRSRRASSRTAPPARA